MDYKLGKKKARKDSIKLKMSSYLLKKLPAPPTVGGHLELLRGVQDWGMLGNDKYGDCVWAGAAHETMLWCMEAKTNTIFSENNALAAYSAVTGFTPNDPDTDQGTDMQVAAKYRRDSGLTDDHGRVHKIVAYLAIQSKDIKQAVHLFGAAGIGIKFPDYAMDLFKEGKDWTVQKGKVEGGHYIPALAYDKDWVYIVTWGKLIRASWEFIEKYMDEGVVYLSHDMLTRGRTLEGFDLKTLQEDLKAITTS